MSLMKKKKSLEEKQQLLKKKTALWNYLIRWCTTTFGEMFAAWIHIKAIRLYVEAVLRYGLPASGAPVNTTLMFALLEPSKNKEKQLREALAQLYSRLANANLTQALDVNETDLSGFGSDFYPYVYLPINLYE
jgi:V-type H+-transporting ATPase subunit C